MKSGRALVRESLNLSGGQWQMTIDSSLLRYGDELSDPRTKSTGIPTLNKDDPWPAESTDKAFTGGEAGDPSRRGLFNVVGGGCRPGHQMAVVHDIFLPRSQFDLVNGPEAIQDKHPFPADLQDKEPLSSE